MLYNGGVQTSNKVDSTIPLYGLSIFGKSKAGLLALVEKRLNNKNGLMTVATPNPEQVVLAHNDATFNGYLHQFDLLLPDGQGLVWASRMLAAKQGGQPLMERVAGREVVAFILGQAQQQHLKVLIIGGRGYEGGIIPAASLSAAESCVIVPATSRYDQALPFPLYWTMGYQTVAAPTAAEQHQLESAIADLKPDVVLVAFGAPYQEGWVVNNRELLSKNEVRLAMVVGGSFDYLLGKVPKTPLWVSQFGFEWLFRLITQPWRWKRQLKLIEFIGLTFKEIVRAN